LLRTADTVLSDMSWDKTWNEMKEKIECAL
jgi:hypothetical protein